MTTILGYPPAPAAADPMCFAHLDAKIRTALKERGWRFYPAVPCEACTEPDPNYHESDVCEACSGHGVLRTVLPL